MAHLVKSEASTETDQLYGIKLIDPDLEKIRDFTSYLQQEILEVFNLSNKISLERLCTAFAIPESVLGRWPNS